MLRLFFTFCIAVNFFLMSAVSDTYESIFLRWLLENKKNCAEKVDFIVMDL